MKHNNFIISLILCLVSSSHGYVCDRTPKNADIKKENNRYMIEISGNPSFYSPGKTYTISLKSKPSNPLTYYFYEFFLVVEPYTKTGNFEIEPVGEFKTIDSTITAFTDKCRNAVVEWSKNVRKSNIEIEWVAPVDGNDCVAFKATVIESKEFWFMDDGELTKVLCKEQENMDEQAPPLQKCTACDEAKYELAFQRLWTRNTHPKDYPINMWESKLGEVIGASHVLGKSFWEYNQEASEGLKLLAEEGDTSLLENDLKKLVQSEDVRTIIKARELSYPNITGTTYTVFRVDKHHHLISLVAKIIPSPDWIVGVANLELCTEEGTWKERRYLNLYPWDIGTDDGTSYKSADVPVSSPKPITQITSDMENYPFYDENGEKIKPIAQLRVTRQKLYKNELECNTDSEEEGEIETQTESKECKEGESDITRRETPEQSTFTEQSQPLETGDLKVLSTGPSYSEVVDCEMSPWSDWGPCSTTVPCTKGFQLKERHIVVHPSNGGLSCPKRLQRRKKCTVPCNADCVLGKWSSWSPCSRTCGPFAIQQRTRPILVYPSKDGKQCDGPRIHIRNCSLPLVCDSLE